MADVPKMVKELLRKRSEKQPKIMWHGSPTGKLVVGPVGLHLGTYDAADQALRARLYHGKYSNGEPIPKDAKGTIDPYLIKGPMRNDRQHPVSDEFANSRIKGNLTRGTAKRGLYYTNRAEDEGSVSAVVPSVEHVEKIEIPTEYQPYSTGGDAKDIRRAVQIAKSSRITDLARELSNKSGDMQRYRVERAADSTNLERFSDPAIRDLLTSGLVAIDKPSKFTELASPLWKEDPPEMRRGQPYPHWLGVPNWQDKVKIFGDDREGYIKYLRSVGPLDKVPLLQLRKPVTMPSYVKGAAKKEKQYIMPAVMEHDGRHRALALGDEPTMPISIQSFNPETMKAPLSARIPKLLTLARAHYDTTEWGKQGKNEYVKPPEELFADGGPVDEDPLRPKGEWSMIESKSPWKGDWRKFPFVRNPTADDIHRLMDMEGENVVRGIHNGENGEMYAFPGSLLHDQGINLTGIKAGKHGTVTRIHIERNKGKLYSHDKHTMARLHRATGGGVKPFPRSKDPEAWVNGNYARHTEDVPVAWLAKMQGNRRRLNDTEYADLKRRLIEEGIREPVMIQFGSRSRRAKLGEGNHRLMIAQELGYTHLPARVYRGTNIDGPDYSHDLIPEPDKYFPADAKPSEVFKSLKPRAIGGRADENDDTWWHGSGSGDLRGGESGLHLGTRAAAEDALNARIGFPAEGSWDGTREYGKTKLAGKKTILKRDKYGVSGHNVYAPDEDYYPHEHPNGMPMVSRGFVMRPEWKPNIAGYRLKGPMSNTTATPHDDWKANGYMKRALNKGNAKRGYYYRNEGEDSGSISAVVPSERHIEPLKRATGGRTKAERQALMIARDHQALLRRVANIYQGPQGGRYAGPGGGGYAGPGGGMYIGPSNYAKGGKIGDNGGPPLDEIPPFKLYSGAAKVIREKGQAKGTPQQFAALPGIKPDELKHGKFTDLPSRALSKEDVARHLEENMVPLTETTLGRSKIPEVIVRQNPKDAASIFFQVTGREPANEAEMVALARRDPSVYDEIADAPKYREYTLPGGENYRETLVQTPPSEGEDIRRRLQESDAAVARVNAEWDRVQEEYPHGHPARREAAQRVIDLNRENDELHNESYRTRNAATYTHGHWDDHPNVLAHIRMHDRTGPNGEKILHVEEIQSDWGQEGREQGFAPPPEELQRAVKARDAYLAELPARVRAELDRRIAKARSEGKEPDVETAKQIAEEFDRKPREAANFLGERDRHDQLLNDAMPARTGKNHIPSGPYVDSTQKWTDLALKRVLHEAAHGGYDKVVFTPGVEQNKRYSLSKRVSQMHYDPENEELYYLLPRKKGFSGASVSRDELPGYVGKEVAQKLLATPRGPNPLTSDSAPVHSLKGKDLEVGGSGMRGYYDDIMPKRLQALVKQHDPQAQVKLHGYVYGKPSKLTLKPWTDDLEGPHSVYDGSRRLAQFNTRAEAEEFAQRAEPEASSSATSGALHSLDVTPQLRQSIKTNGFSQFKRGGYIGRATGGRAGHNGGPSMDEIPPFKLYSGAAKLIEAKGQAKATPQQYAAIPGIKPDELKHARYADLPAKPQAKEEVLKHLRENMVPLQETILQDSPPPKQEGTGFWAEAANIEDNTTHRRGLPRFDEDKYRFPGGKNYREVILHLPRKTTENDLMGLRIRHTQALDQYNALKQRWEELGAERTFDHPVTAMARTHADEALNRVMEIEKQLKEAKAAGAAQNFKAENHWPDTDNPVAHLRMATRQGPNGEKILHVEEIQSDWGQQGRDKGFNDPDAKARAVQAFEEHRKELREKVRQKTEARGLDVRTLEGLRDPQLLRLLNDPEMNAKYAELTQAKVDADNTVPRGPYVDNTQKWTDLALKRVLHEAAHGNYDKVVFTPGAEQNKRWSLSKAVDEVHYDPKSKYLIFKPKGKDRYDSTYAYGDKLQELLGKEMSEKLLATTPAKGSSALGTYDPVHSLVGTDLELGGSGMRGYYDDIMPKRLQALVKQHDPQAKVQLHAHKLPGVKGGISGGDIMEQMGIPQEQHREYWGSLPQETRDQHFADFWKQQEENGPQLHSLDITPQMRDSIKQNGFSQFKRGGYVPTRSNMGVIDRALQVARGATHGYR